MSFSSPHKYSETNKFSSPSQPRQTPTTYPNTTPSTGRRHSTHQQLLQAQSFFDATGGTDSTGGKKKKSKQEVSHPDRARSLLLPQKHLTVSRVGSGGLPPTTPERSSPLPKQKDTPSLRSLRPLPPQKDAPSSPSASLACAVPP
jgi:hypothetical protein